MAFAIVLIPMLGAFFARFLITDWRYPRRTVAMVFWTMQAVHFAASAALLAVFGPVAPLRLFLGIVPVIAYNLVFFCTALSGYQDGRALFSIISVQLLSAVGCAGSTVFFPYGSPFWIAAWAAFVLVFCLLLQCFCRQRIHAMLHSIDTGWRRVCVMPIAMLACLYALFVFPLLRGRWDLFNRTAVLLVCLMSILLYIGIYRFLRIAREQYEADRRADHLRYQMDALRQQAEQLAAVNRENSLYRHDQRHSLRLLDAFLQAGDLEQARKILDHMTCKLEGMSRLSAAQRYTGAPIIDAALQLSAQRARAIGARFTVALQPSNHLSADYEELALMMFNALENALNACQQLPDGAQRAIRVEGKDLPEQYFFSITNTCPGKVELDAFTGLPITRRKGHGYGTQSIAAFARRHGAVLRYCAGAGELSMQILFRKDLYHQQAEHCAAVQGDVQQLQP